METREGQVMLLTARGGSRGSGIAVVRVSGGGRGPQTVEQLNSGAVEEFLARHFSGKPAIGRAVHGQWRDGSEIIDDPVVLLGSGWADICLHGGEAIVTAVLEMAQREGFEPADHGFFQEAESEIEREMLEALPLARTREALEALLEQPNLWANLSIHDSRLTIHDKSLYWLLHGARIAIVGQPNVGKSTLANQLFGRQRSITADLPGTTRDWVGEWADIDGLPVMLLDTPGQRTTTDPIEQAAIAASQNAIHGCDLVVRVLDATHDWVRDPSRSTIGSATLHDSRLTIHVVNKIDLGAAWDFSGDEFVRICARSGSGVDEVKRKIRAFFGLPATARKGIGWWTQRQREIVEPGS